MTTHAPVTAPGPAEVFDRWATCQAEAWEADQDGPRRRGFSPDTVPVYRSIWEIWMRWLDGQPEKAFEGAQWRWAVASAEHVHAFVTGPAPVAGDKTRKRRKPISEKKMADFTAQRYWRILRDVYAYACGQGWRLDNPALGLGKTRPSVSRNARKPQVLPPFVLRMLRDTRTLVRLLPQDHEGHWWVLRDRAILSLLAHCGMTASELIALRGADVRQGTTPLHGRPSAQLEAIPSPVAPRIDLPGRDLELSAEALAALLPWLEVRGDLLVKQRITARELARAQGEDPGGPAMLASPQQPLFLSREAPEGRHTRLDPSSLYVIARRCLTAAYATPRVAGTTDPTSYVAAGPAVIRNAVIQAWADHYGEEEAARMAGLESIASVRRA